MTAIDIEDALEFIKAHGKGAYKGWTDEQILFEIERASKDDTFLYCRDEDTGKCVGVVTARKLENEKGHKIMHVVGICTSQPGIIQVFYRVFRQLYPQYKALGGVRHGKVFMWNIKQMEHFDSLLTRI